MGDYGPKGLSWQDLSGYCAMTGELLSEYDLSVLDVIETEYFAAMADANKRIHKVKGNG